MAPFVECAEFCSSLVALMIIIFKYDLYNFTLKMQNVTDLFASGLLFEGVSSISLQNNM